MNLVHFDAGNWPMINIQANKSVKIDTLRYLAWCCESGVFNLRDDIDYFLFWWVVANRSHEARHITEMDGTQDLSIVQMTDILKQIQLIKLSKAEKDSTLANGHNELIGNIV